MPSLWPNRHTTPQHYGVQRRKGHMRMDPCPSCNGPPNQHDKYSSRMDTPLIFPYLAPTAARSNPMYSCTFGIFPYQKTSQINAHGKCRHHASCTLESSLHTTPPETSKELLEHNVADVPLSDSTAHHGTCNTLLSPAPEEPHLFWRTIINEDSRTRRSYLAYY